MLCLFNRSCHNLREKSKVQGIFCKASLCPSAMIDINQIGQSLKDIEGNSNRDDHFITDRNSILFHIEQKKNHPRHAEKSCSLSRNLTLPTCKYPSCHIAAYRHAYKQCNMQPSVQKINPPRKYKQRHNPNSLWKKAKDQRCRPKQWKIEKRCETHG